MFLKRLENLEQRMVSMKMFLVSIGLLLVLNIGMGAALYLDGNHERGKVSGHALAIALYLEEVVNETEAELTTIQEDINSLNSHSHNTSHSHNSLERTVNNLVYTVDNIEYYLRFSLVNGYRY